MKLIRYNDVFPGLFDDFVTRNWSNNNHAVPAVNIKETDDDFQIEVAAPGLKKEDFKIELDNDVLTLSSEVKNEKESKEDNYTYRQFGYQSFKRSFQLPKGKVNADKVNAKYENGVLHLVLPKLEEAKPIKKQIAIK